MCDIDFQPLGQAFATVDAPLIYAEAKRQYDALRSRAATSTRLTRWRVDLQTFYQDQFDTATAHLDLDLELKLMLLKICFAYKTRDRVLAFLDDVGTATFSWVKPLRNLVLTSGRDSMHDDAVDVPALASAGDSTPTSDAAETEAAFFTIPTLPIAFPKHYFLAWASHVPRAHLTIENVLAHPAACGLGLTRLAKNQVRFRMQDNCQAAEEEEGEGWDEFFTALCVGRTELAWYEKKRVGYTIADIGGWVGRWRVARDAEAREGAGETAGGAAGVSPLGKRRMNPGDEGARPTKRVKGDEGTKPKKRVRWDENEKPKKRVRWDDESEKPKKRVRWEDEADAVEVD